MRYLLVALVLLASVFMVTGLIAKANRVELGPGWYLQGPAV